MWIRLLTSAFWSGTGISLKEDASVIRERDIQADRRSRNKLLIASESPFLRSPRKSTRRASRELKVPQSTVRKTLLAKLAKQMDWPRWTKWPDVLQVAPEITGPDRLWLFPLGVREEQSLCTSTTRNRGWAAGTHRWSCQLHHMLQRVWSELDYRIDICRLTRGGHIECVCDTTWNCMCLCNCSHQFCKNIPVAFDLRTTWNQGVFLCSPCITGKLWDKCRFYTTACTWELHTMILCAETLCYTFRT